MTPSTLTPAPTEEVPLRPAPPAPAVHRPASTRSGWVGGVVVGLALAGAAGFAAGKWGAAGRHEEAETKPTASEDALPPGMVKLSPAAAASVGVKVEPVAHGPLVDHAWRTGTVQFNANAVAHVTSPVEGVVRQVAAELGRPAAAGGVLLVIDSRAVGEAKFAYANAKLALAAARAQHEWAAAVTANATELVKALAAERPVADIEARFRDKPLGEWREKLVPAYARLIQLRAAHADTQAAGGAVPESAARRTRAEFETAAAQYRSAFEEAPFLLKQQALAAGQRLREAQTAADTARAHLLMIGYTAAEADRLDPAAEGAAVSWLPVKAPFAGTVTRKHAVTGERVAAGADLVQVADLSSVWVRADVFEPDLPLVRGLAGKPVKFRAPAAGLAERDATVRFVGDVIDPESRALPLVAEVANPDRDLKPGLFVEVGLARGTTGPVLSVPASAVQRHENRTFVFVPAGDGLFRRQDVAVGRTAGGRVEVTAGLASGDEVVTDGGFTLKTELLKDQIAGE